MAEMERQSRSHRPYADAWVDGVATRPSRRGGLRGFTLLEVMVSLGILAVALMALGDLNGGAARMHSYATKLTIAVQLARGKMLDVKQLLIKDGLSDYSKEYKGVFDDEGWPEFSWRAQVIKPDFEADGAKVLSGVTSGLGLNPTDISSLIGNIPGLGALTGGGSASPASGSSGASTNPSQMLAALGPIGGMVDGQLKQLSQQVKDSVREIKLTVSWKSTATTEESFDVVEHIIQLPDASQEQQANATAGAPVSGLPGSTGQQGYNNSGGIGPLNGNAGLSGGAGGGSVPRIPGLP